MRSIFSSICPPFACLLWKKCLFSPSVHFLIVLFVCFAIELYEFMYFGYNPLSDIWLVNIFSHFIGCLFILLMVYFAVQKLFNLMQSHFFIFAFVACAFRTISKKKRCQDKRLNLRYDFQEEVEMEAYLEKKKTQLSRVIFGRKCHLELPESP